MSPTHLLETVWGYDLADYNDTRTVGERFWSPLKVTHNPDGTQSVSYGKAWEEFSAAAARWL